VEGEAAAAAESLTAAAKPQSTTSMLSTAASRSLVDRVKSFLKSFCVG
jgi:hypothetical protein